jgi:hypothetical protein
MGEEEQSTGYLGGPEGGSRAGEGRCARLQPKGKHMAEVGRQFDRREQEEVRAGGEGPQVVLPPEGVVLGEAEAKEYAFASEVDELLRFERAALR